MSLLSLKTGDISRILMSYWLGKPQPQILISRFHSCLLQAKEIWEEASFGEHGITKTITSPGAHNPLEQNIRFYLVVNGVRHKLANFNHIISVKTWHTLQVVALGSHFQILFNEQPVIDVSDETFQAGGEIGLWTKADALTYFDDLQLSIVN